MSYNESCKEVVPKGDRVSFPHFASSGSGISVPLSSVGRLFRLQAGKFDSIPVLPKMAHYTLHPH